MRVLLSNSIQEETGLQQNGRIFSVYYAGFKERRNWKSGIKVPGKIAVDKDIKVLIGVITATNSASIALCEDMDYEKCAHYKQVGEKFGQILDVVAYQKILTGI